MTEEMIQKVLQYVEELLRNPTVDLSYSRGITHYHNLGDQFMSAEPTDGFELTIKINGGAVERTEQSPRGLFNPRS